MKVCVVGAGNIGLSLIGVLALRHPDYEIVLCTSGGVDAADFTFCDEENKTKHDNLSFKVEADAEKALSGADYVFCTYPAFLRRDFIKKNGEFLSPNCKLGFVPGYGGAEYVCKPLVDKGVTIFGLQRVPFVARQEHKKIAHLLSRKSTLYVAAIPKNATHIVSKDMEDLIGIPTIGLNEYLAVTLAPSNPLLHLTGLYNVFKDYKKGDHYDEQLMFYEEWNDDTSRMLLSYDDELQEICKAMKDFDLHEVVPLGTYYESETPEAMTKKLKSIEAFKVVQVPLKKDGEAYYPDFDSRMFVEDFPFGIAIIKYFALLNNIKTPTIDEILRFYRDKTGICYYNDDDSFGKDFEKSGAPGNFGLDTMDKIVKFYNGE